MTTDQIESLFYSLLEEKAIYNELTGISEDKIYNWRKGRGAKPTIGDMLNVLYQLKKIMIKKASPGEVDFMNEIEEAWNKWPSKETLLEKGKLDNLTSTSRAERMLFGSSKLPGDLNNEISELEELENTFNKIGLEYKKESAKNKTGLDIATTSHHGKAIYDTVLTIENGIGYLSFWGEFYFLESKFVNHGLWE